MLHCGMRSCLKAWLAFIFLDTKKHAMVIPWRLFRWGLSWKEFVRNKRTKPSSTNNPRSFKSFVRNTSVSCVLYCLGDIVEQRVEGYKLQGTNDWSRTRRMAVMGAFIGGIDTFWYTNLDRMIPGADATSVGKKVLLDQIMWSPFCCSSFFYGIYGVILYIAHVYQLCLLIGMSRMEGSTSKEAINEIKIKFWPTYKVSSSQITEIYTCLYLF